MKSIIKMLNPMQFRLRFILVCTALLCYVMHLCVALEEVQHNQLTADVIINIVLGASAILDAVSYLILYNAQFNRDKHIKRKRRSVSKIFQELGSYYVRRS